MLAADGAPVEITPRGLFTADPVHLHWESRSWRLTGWAGPWPVDEHWWAPGGSAALAARAQVRITDSQDRVLLLGYRDGVWEAEGVYG
ncbi:nucleotidyltransferase/DNA polymerase involved in DNA repair [Mycobacteroides abscessus subsp. abscessus]|nr:nucleotidyltransferase/DNA polymerase involved in DNA repair [Mycobacteroides abscessus subsp. abscessus]